MVAKVRIEKRIGENVLLVTEVQSEPEMMVNPNGLINTATSLMEGLVKKCRNDGI